MKLLQLTLENFRGAPDGIYSFADPSTGTAHDLVLVTGAAASGKTAILDAIAAVKELVGGYGPLPDSARLRKNGAQGGKIAATWLLSGSETARAGLAGPRQVTEVLLDDGRVPMFDPGLSALFAAYSTGPASGKFELFPANRRLSLTPVPLRVPPGELAAARWRLSKDPAKYAGVQHALIELAVHDAMHATEQLDARGVVARWEQSDSLVPIKRSLAALAPWLRLTGVKQAGSLYQVRFLRSSGIEVDLADLSESEQQALLFSVMFDRVGLNGSIVLIDQPELFIHPGDHVRFLRAIEGLGADNQLIVATASEALLAAAEPQRIVRLASTGQG
jgi:hypothetical protein